jgi:hypothetical protein
VLSDDRIRQLTQEVLTAVGGAREEREASAGLEARVERLENAVRQLQGQPPVAEPVAVVTVPVVSFPARGAVAHPSLRLLDVPGGEDRCILEPDKPCEKSGRCRSFGF